ncbi:MAG: HAD-IA family hydrolase [Acetobacteraceae bacterium]|nr:HAD-IA family hydrolase [Acetobacteraceae bacterium]
MLYRVIFFDVFDTLIDISGVWERIERRTFEAVRRLKPEVGAEEFERAFRAARLRVAARPGYLGSLEFMAETLKVAAARLGTPAPLEEQRRIIGEEFDQAPPFPDARAAVETLAGAARVGLLTNTDNDILEAALRRAGLAFTLRVTSEDARCYKPHPAIFELALRRAGVEARDALLVGDSQNDDILGARRAGMAVAWVNRRGEALKSPALRPDYEVPDLEGLVRLLLPGRQRAGRGAGGPRGGNRRGAGSPRGKDRGGADAGGGPGTDAAVPAPAPAGGQQADGRPGEGDSPAFSGELVVDFSHPAALDPRLAGGKAAGLRLARAQGLSVPQGFCVLTPAFSLHARAAGLDSDPALDEAWERGDLEGFSARAQSKIRSTPLPAPVASALAEACARLEGPAGARAEVAGPGGPELAVRSSAPWEDGAEASFGGVLESFLGVRGLGRLCDALRDCWASAFSTRALGYMRHRSRLDPRAWGTAVLVQRLVPARASGVAFSRDPVGGRSGAGLIEGSPGPAGVVGGEAPAFGCRFSVRRARPRLAWGRLPAGLDRPSLAQVARALAKLERAAGLPVDVEWAWDGARVWVLQVRPITALHGNRSGAGPGACGAPAPGTDAALVDRFAQPISPCYASVLERFSRRVALDFPPRWPGSRYREVPYVFHRHRVYWNLRYDRLYFSRLPGGRVEAGPLRRAWFLYHLLTLHRRWYRRLPGYLDRCRRLGQVALERLDDAGLLAHFRSVERNFYGRIGREHFRALALSQASLRLLEAGLKPLEDATELAGRLVGARTPRNLTVACNLRLLGLADLARRDPETLADLSGLPAPEAWEKLNSGHGDPRLREGIRQFLEEFGHRSVTSDDLAGPRWSDEPHRVVALIQQFLALGVDDAGSPGDDGEFARRLEPALDRRWPPAAPRLAARIAGRWGRARLRVLAALAREYMVLRENQRFYFDRSWVLLRATLLEMGRRLAARGALSAPEDVFFLRLEEALRLMESGGGSAWTAALAGRRRAEMEADAALSPPFYLRDGQVYSVHGGRPHATMKGVAVSPGRASGPARVVRAADDLGRVRRGEIAVVPVLHPSWTPVLMVAAGLVMNYGSALSHGAVVAREYGVPAVVLNDAATEFIPDGSAVEVDGNRGRVYLLAEGGGERRGDSQAKGG